MRIALAKIIFSSFVFLFFSFSHRSFAVVDPIETGVISNQSFTKQSAIQIPKPPQTQASTYVLTEAGTGKILAGKDENVRMPPASLTKIMTMYIIADALKRGQIHLNDEVTISEKAWRTGGSRMFVQVGDKVRVEDLIKGIVVTSGNDACVAMAEYIAGSEEAFSDLMNQQAEHLGMKNSHFTDSNGMPAADHYTTANDMAILARAFVQNFPDFYPLFKQKEFTYNNIHQMNRNKLLWSDPSVDGVKTGHTDTAGYCLVASAKKKDMRLISVVMNSSSPNKRTEDTQKLLAYGFRFYKYISLYRAGQPLANVRVWYGETKNIPVGMKADLGIVIPAEQAKTLKAMVQLPKTLKAPIQMGQIIGEIRVTLNDKPLLTKPVIALRASPKASVLQRMRDSISLMLNRFLDDNA